MPPRDTLISHPWSAHRRRTGMTQGALSRLLGVSPGFMVRVEQGLFSEAPRAFVDYYSRKLGLDPDVLESEYYAYQGSTRRAFRRVYLGFDLLEVWVEFCYLPAWDKYKQEARVNPGAVAEHLIHPLVYYYTSQGLSRIGFCKGLCVDQQGILRYERGSNMPLSLVRGIKGTGWEPADLDKYVQMWRRYYNE